MNESDIEFRILDLLDGNLSDEEFTALQSELLRDADARKTFKRFVRLHSELEIRYTSTAKIERIGIVPVDRIIARQRRRIVRGSLLAAAALLVLSAVAMWLIMAPASPPTLGTFRTAPNSAFTLIHTGDDDAPMGNVLTEGSKIRLVSGTLEGNFASGVRVVAEAPCEFRVLTKDRIALRKGVAWFHVPPKAVGFAVETVELTIVDLGTEFGIVAANREGDEVHVAKGSVEVMVSAQGGETQILQAGQARRVAGDGQLQTIRPDASRFRTELPRTVPIAIANHSFEADDVSRLPNNLHMDIVPTDWSGFDDGRNNAASGNKRGLVSHAPGSVVNPSLGVTPDPTDADQSFFTVQRDLYQVLPATLIANSVYTLTVDIGDRDYSESGGNPGTPVIRLGTGTTPGTGLLTPSARKVPPQIDGGWVTWSFTYVTSATTPGLGERLRIELTNGTKVGWFDNVRLSVTKSSE